MKFLGSVFGLFFLSTITLTGQITLHKVSDELIFTDV